MKKLEGKVAVLTGATDGMAFATAQVFVEEGAYVFITGRRKEKLDGAVKTIGKNVTGVQGDVGNLADLDRLYETVKAEKGHIDILFASAGVGELDKPLGSIASYNPMNRFGKPHEIATAVLFLASDDASFLTGSNLFVDGGMGQV